MADEKKVLKIHVGVYTDSKKIVAFKTTTDSSYDGSYLSGIVKDAHRGGRRITKVLADGAYDAGYIFAYLDRRSIVPAIKVKRNHMSAKPPPGKTDTPRRAVAKIQLSDYQKWSNSVGYGRRWFVESAFSVLKRTFGEYVMAHRRKNMEKELLLKAALYNKLIDK